MDERHMEYLYVCRTISEHRLTCGFLNYTDWENWRFANPEKAKRVIEGDMRPLQAIYNPPFKV